MSRYAFSPRAHCDVEEIVEVLERRRPVAAARQLDRIRKCCQLLGKNPLMGEARDDLRPGLRIITVDSFVLAFEPREDGI